MIDTIYVENFRRIRRGELKLRDGITVVTGNNGTGKSTIAVEALLFNLYGRQKAGTAKDSIHSATLAPEELTYTAVDFTHDGLHYRCRRYISKKGSTMATLYSYTDEEYERLLKQTDQRHLDKTLGTAIATSATGVNNAIEQIIGLDYDGYRASLVSTQKELDSLASLTKEKKKQFFLDLLGYSRLDDCKRLASKELSSKTGMRDGLMRQSIDPDATRRRIERDEKTLDDTNRRLDVGRQKLDEMQARLDAVAVEYDEALSAHDSYMQAKADDDADRARVDDLTARRALQQEIIDANAMLANEYDEDSSLSARLASLRERATKASTWASMREDYDGRLAAHDDGKARLADIDAETARLRDGHGDEPDLDATQTALSQAQQRVAMLQRDRTHLDGEMRNMSSLIDDVRAGRIAKCPTCGSEIASDDGRRHLEGELAQISDEIARTNADLTPAMNDVAARQDELSIAKARLRTWHDVERRLGALAREHDVVARDVADTEAAIAERKARLDATVADAMSRDDYLRLCDDIADLEPKVRREDEIRNAYKAKVEAERQVGLLDVSIGEANDRIAARAGIVRQGAMTERRFAKASADKEKAESTIAKYHARLTELSEQRGTLVASIAAGRESLDRAEEQRRQVAELSDSIQTWTGVKAVIDRMRESLPSRITPTISDEASRLLGIATGGAYSMLEITDDYEVYVYTDIDRRPIAQMSGGEQDVVSLCIRIAISEMILEATGEPSQTMVLDEIFGALDDARRRETCDALRNLSATLPRIVCITHIDEIKDMADYTYVVEMGEDGMSTVREVVEANVMRHTLRDDAKGEKANSTNGDERRQEDISGIINQTSDRGADDTK